MGNILVTKHESQDEPSSTVYEVIDGQQRLTTLSLFLLAIWQITSSLKGTLPSGLEDDYVSQMYSDIGRRLMINRDPASPRMQLLEDDAKIYQELIRAVCEKDEPQVKKNRIFVRRYNHIVELFEDWRSDIGALYAFYDKLINVLVLQIEAASIGDAFSIFSSLNSKGLPLTLVDLLKSEFLGMGEGTDNQQQSKLQRQWEMLDQTFTIDGNGSDVDTKAFTQFFLNNYDAFESTIKSSVTKGKALNLYQDVIKKKTRLARLGNADTYLNEIIKRARILRQHHRAFASPHQRSSIGRSHHSATAHEPPAIGIYSGIPAAALPVRRCRTIGIGRYEDAHHPPHFRFVLRATQYHRSTQIFEYPRHAH